MQEVAKTGLNQNDLLNCKTTTPAKADCSDSGSIFNKKKLGIISSNNKDNNDESRIKAFNSRSSMKIIPSKNASNLTFEEKQALLKEANSDPLHRKQKLKEIEKNIHENKYKKETVNTNTKKPEEPPTKKEPVQLTDTEKLYAEVLQDPRVVWFDMLK